MIIVLRLSSRRTISLVWAAARWVGVGSLLLPFRSMAPQRKTKREVNKVVDNIEPAITAGVEAAVARSVNNASVSDDAIAAAVARAVLTALKQD